MNRNGRRKAIVVMIAAAMTAASAPAKTVMAYQYGNTAGTVHQVSVANLKPNWVVTGVRNGEGNAELICWQSLGTRLVREGSAVAGPVADLQVATVGLNSGLAVTVARDLSGQLQLVSWPVSSGVVTAGSILRAEQVFTVWGAAKLDSSHLVVAFQDQNNNMWIDVFSAGSGGTLTEETSYDTGEVSTWLSVTALSGGQFVTARVNGNSALALDSWSFIHGTIAHQKSVTSGTIGHVGISTWAEEGHVATAVENAGNDLEVIDWIVNPETGAFTREGSAVKPTSTWMVASSIGNGIFTAAVLLSGQIDVGVWEYDPAFMEAASAKGEMVNNVGIGAAPLNSGNFAVTATCNGSGDLQVDVWTYYTTP